MAWFGVWHCGSGFGGLRLRALGSRFGGVGSQATTLRVQESNKHVYCLPNLKYPVLVDPWGYKAWGSGIRVAAF